MDTPAWRPRLLQRSDWLVFLAMAVLALPGQLSAAADSSSPTSAVGVEATAGGDSAVTAGTLLQGLQALPVYPPDAQAQRDAASLSYFTSAAIAEVWDYYEQQLRARGWQRLDEGSFVGESGRQATFRKAQAQIHVGVWIGNARDSRNATRVDIRHLGAVQVEALPRVDAIADSVHCFPQTCVYRSQRPHAGLLQRIIETLQPLGWEVVPLPPDTVRSAEAASSIVTLRQQSSILDIHLGRPPAEAAGGADVSTPVQYSVRLASD